MRTYLDCIPCLMHQALRAARQATDDEEKIKRVLDEVGLMINTIPMESPPPKIAMGVYRKIREITENPDPYRQLKIDSTREALSLYPVLKEKITSSSDKLFTAIRLAIAGNIIDFGTSASLNIKDEIDRILDMDLAVSDFDRFKTGLTAADEVLFIADNAGECVFDRVLIEEIKKPVTYVVRSAPVINDATFADACMAGVDRVASLMASGTDAPGTVLGTCNATFLRKFYRSSFVISKGQGNFEALSETAAPVFFMLIAKCPIVARDIGANVGDMILKGQFV